MTRIDWESRRVDEGEPLHRMVYHILHYAIVSGQVQPGEHLPENVLASSLKVSRTPIRMAILQLEKEGLMIRKNGRAVVHEGPDRERRELLETRKVLECLAAASACRNVQDEDIKRLEEINKEFAIELRMGNVLGSARADECFHEEIYRIADNRVLLRTIHGLEKTIYGYRIRECISDVDIEMQIGEHAQIIDALRVGREDLAERAVIQHITERKYTVRRQKRGFLGA